MSTPSDQARLALQKARAALRNGELNEARQWAEQAAALAPQMEDPWLVLAAVASPRASLEYVQRALKINPQSTLARRALEWATERVRQADRLSGETEKSASASAAVPSPVAPAKAEPQAEVPESRDKRPTRRRPVLAALLLGLGCLAAAAAWFTGLLPLATSLIQRTLILSTPTHLPLWAPVTIPKPTYTPQGPSSQGSAWEAAALLNVLPACAGQGLSLFAQLSTNQLTEAAAVLATPGSGLEAASPAAQPRWPGSLSMVPDTESLYDFSCAGTLVDVHF